MASQKLYTDEFFGHCKTASRRHLPHVRVTWSDGSTWVQLLEMGYSQQCHVTILNMLEYRGPGNGMMAKDDWPKGRSLPGGVSPWIVEELQSMC
ncbi:hypothetical protein BJY01DRAFT_226306 [Aspergillus pseudoustus]|uniref:Uncharacterized protein n=1 Tax=Aspergillus pseudoustus TaxID=1810923 RepID=A0ABR4IXB3_9EURO